MPETSPDLSIALEWGSFAVHSLVTAHKLGEGDPSDVNARLALAENLVQLASAHEAFGTALGAVLVNGTYARLLVLRPGLVAIENTAGAGSRRELREALAGTETQKAQETQETQETQERQGSQTVADFCNNARVGSWPHQLRATELDSAGAYLYWARRAVDQLRPYNVHHAPGRLAFSPWHGDRVNGDIDGDATPKASATQLPEEEPATDGRDAPQSEDAPDEKEEDDEDDDGLPLGATARSFSFARTMRILTDSLRDWRVVAVSPGLIEQLAERVLG